MTRTIKGLLKSMTRPRENAIADACEVCETESTRNMDGIALCQQHLGFALGARDVWTKDFNERGEVVPSDLSDTVVKLMKEHYRAGKIA